MAQPIRVERVREKVKFEVARILQQEMSDPRMGFVTVVGCDLSPDYRYATIHVSFLDDREGEVSRMMHMLEDARGYIQSKVASRLSTRVTPELRFERDIGAQRSIEVSSLLDEIRREREEREAASGGAEAPAPDED